MGGNVMKKYVIVLLTILMPSLLLSSDKEEKKKQTALKVRMLEGVLENCPREVKKLEEKSENPDDTAYVHAYALGFNDSIPAEIPDIDKQKMRFQFIVLYNIHAADAASAKSQCCWGISGAKFGAWAAKETTACAMVDKMLKETDERLEKAKKDRNKEQEMSEGPVLKLLSMTYQMFVQAVYDCAHRVDPKVLDYHDVAQDIKKLLAASRIEKPLVVLDERVVVSQQVRADEQKTLENKPFEKK